MTQECGNIILTKILS